MTLIVIIVDGKFQCSFDGILDQWKNERFFKVYDPKPQPSITKLIGPPAVTIRTKQLRIFANVHSELDMRLALFCYDMEDPTRKRIEEDMFHYEREQHQKRSKH